MSIVEVYLWGVKVGALGYSPDQTQFTTFEYDKDFIKKGVEISPIKVPTSINIHTFENISYRTFHGFKRSFLRKNLCIQFALEITRFP